METDTDYSMMTKMNIVQVIILILLSIERIFKLFVNSKCLKKFTCKFLGFSFVDLQSEEAPQTPPQSPRNINKE